VEEGGLEASSRAFRNISAIIQSRQNGPCTSCYQNVREAPKRYIPQISVGVRPSFSASLIERHDRYGLNELEMAYLAGQM
jgi:hypothetical protein